MVQASAKVTIECEYEIIWSLLNGVISSDLEWPVTRVSMSQYFSEANISKMVHFGDKFTIGC